MKITCQSCQSKYNVADEKVQGKIVKIRCRKCGGTIVVNATSTATAASPTNGTPAADDAAVSPGALGDGTADEWHVNVGEGDPRTMALAELVSAYNAGQVTSETFVWSDGMTDWKPLAEVDAIVAAIHAAAGAAAPPGQPAVQERAVEPHFPPAAARPVEEPPPQAVASAAAPPPAAYEPPAADYGVPYAAQAAAAPVEAKRAAVVKRETRGRDLFSTQGGEELQTSAPAASDVVGQTMDDGKLTGQRNENSVLFSLAVLTKDAEDRAPGDQQAAKTTRG
jgi:predicted Zn finger-like uncharacterized protein